MFTYRKEKLSGTSKNVNKKVRVRRKGHMREGFRRALFIGTEKTYRKELESAGFELVEVKTGFTEPIPVRTCTIVARK